MVNLHWGHILGPHAQKGIGLIHPAFFPNKKNDDSCFFLHVTKSLAMIFLSHFSPIVHPPMASTREDKRLKPMPLPSRFRSRDIFFPEEKPGTDSSMSCMSSYKLPRLFFCGRLYYHYHHIPDVVLSKRIPNKEKISNT